MTSSSFPRITRLQDVLQKLSEANLKLKLHKCKFFTKEVKFLGYKVSTDGMIMDEERIESIRKMPDPINKKELQALLEACNYFRMFVRGYAQIAEPLYELLRKDAKYVWKDRQGQAVELLKSISATRQS